MQQKNGKIVAKREPKVKKEQQASYVPAYSSNNVFEDQVAARHEIKPVKRALKQESTDDESEYTSSPVKRIR